VVVEAKPRPNDKYAYLVGIYIPCTLNDINLRKTRESDERDILLLGYTNETYRKYSPRDVLDVDIYGVIRYNTLSSKFYGLVSPTVANQSSGETTPFSELLAKGIVNINIKPPASGCEGKPVELQGFSKRMMSNFKKMKDHKMWMPFVVHMHVTTDKVHYDLRMLVPDKTTHFMSYAMAEQLYSNNIPLNGSLEGFVITGPMDGQCVTKQPQLPEWMFFDGNTFDINGRSVYLIVATGMYTINNIDDSEIIVEFKTDSGRVNPSPLYGVPESDLPQGFETPKELMEFTGIYTFRMARISVDNNIILLSRNKINVKISGEKLEQFMILHKTCSVTKLSRVIGLSKPTVYDLKESYL